MNAASEHGLAGPVFTVGLGRGDISVCASEDGIAPCDDDLI